MLEPVVTTRIVNFADLKKPAVEGRLYAILDACDAPVVYAKVQEMQEGQAVCLYRGKLDPEVLAEAPYLVRATPDLLEWIQKTVCNTAWGILMIADNDLRSLRKHFRHFLLVEGPEGETLYFRYYDPRVLLPFLASCNKAELEEFFGPVLAYAVTNEERLVMCWQASFK